MYCAYTLHTSTCKMRCKHTRTQWRRNHANRGGIKCTATFINASCSLHLISLKGGRMGDCLLSPKSSAYAPKHAFRHTSHTYAQTHTYVQHTPSYKLTQNTYILQIHSSLHTHLLHTNMLFIQNTASLTFSTSEKNIVS